MTDKHHEHLTEVIAETKAEIERISEQKKSAIKVLELIEEKSPRLVNKIKYLVSAKKAYENIMAIKVAEATEIAEPEPEVEVAEKPKKKSLFKRLKKEPEPVAEPEQPAQEVIPEPSDDLDSAIKDL